MASKNSKSTGAFRKHYKKTFNQNDIIKKLNDLFEDVIDKQAIASVAKSCKYDFTSSVDILLKMSENDNVKCESINKINNIKIPHKNTNEKRSSQVPYVKQPDFNSCIDKINKGYKVLVLLRGLPGSGKTTLSKKIYNLTVSNLENVKPEYHIYSTDDYFVLNGNGHYNFNPTLLSEAHNWNQKRVYNAMQQGISPILIDNTNIMAWEMRSYVIGAVYGGYIIEVVEPQTPWNFNDRELSNRCIHNVPRATVKEMINRYEPNLTPQKLLSIFSLQYSLHNKPPQKRKFPVINISSKTGAEKTFHSSSPNKTKINKNSRVNNKIVQKMIDEKYEQKKDLSEMDSVLKIAEIKDDKLFSNVDVGDKQTNLHLNTAPKKSIPFIKINIGSDLSNLTLENTGNSIDFDQKNSYSNVQNEDKVNYCREFTLIMDNGDLIHSVSSFENDDIVMKSSESSPAVSYDECKNNLSDSDNIIRYTCDDLLNILKQDDRKYIDSILKYSATPKPARVKNKRTESVVTKSEQEQNDESRDAYDLINWDVFPQDLWDNSNSQMSNNTENPTSGFCDYLTDNNQKYSNLLDSPLSMEDNCFVQPLIQIRHISDSHTLQKSESFEKITDKYSVQKEQDIFKDESSQMNQKESDNLINLDIQIVENRENSCQLSESNDNICDLNNISNLNEDSIKSNYEINADSSSSVNKNSSTDSLYDNNVQNKKNQWIRDFFKFPFFHSNKKNEPDTKQHNAKNKLEEVLKDEINKKEMSTNTADSDFKVLIDCNTNMELEGICTLKAYSRNINEYNTFDNSTKINPPTILMLDKSSMTENENVLFDFVSDEQSKRDFKTLVELFPDFPKDNLRDIFDKCKNNIDWAVDLLLDSKQIVFSNKSDEFSKIPNDEIIQKNTIEENINCELKSSNYCEPYVEEQISFINQQISGENSSAHLNNVIKKKSKKSQSPSEFSLELKKQLEEQFVIPDNFYSEHCLKIKKMRQGILEPDFKDFDKVPLTEEPKKDDYDDSTETESVEEEEEESMELDLGTNLIKQLESNFGSAFKESKFVENLRPVIHLPMSIARQLHAFWLESAIEQLCVYEEQLEKMVKEDQEFAQRLQEKENELLMAGKEPLVSDLQEILDMEIALAIAKSDKKYLSEENFNEISLKLTQEKLYELFPDLDKDSICHILEAYDNKFDQTIDVLSYTRKHMIGESNIDYKFSKEDILKQEQNLLIKIKEANVQKTESNQSKPTIIVTSSSNSSTKMSEQEYKMMLGDYYRTEAQYQLSLRTICIHRAQAAYNKGLTQVALYYSEVASLHKRNFEEANALAASSFLSAHAQANSNSVVLDLHYLFKGEALEALDLFLDKHISLLAAKQKKYEFLYLITGRGLRSNNGQPVIKPAVIKRLKQRFLRFIEVNSGFLRVKIRPHDIMACNVQV